MNNKFSIKLLMGLSLALSLLAGCASVSKVAPVYKGMSLSKINRAVTAKRLDDGQEDEEEREEHDEEIEKEIEDIVTIDVKTDDEIKYYVAQKETFIVEVHIDNPNDFEIQSFTLNGQKYANYMFKEGSTMELLLLETTAPSKSGYLDYTIDAIKYIDGTEIKDVDMSQANKSIKVGVAYTSAPSATVISSNVSSTFIELGIIVSDPENLIKDNPLQIHLTDGENVVGSKDLKVGSNVVKFDNLIMSKSYEYGVVAAYDFVDGKDLHPEWLLTNTFTTLGAFKFVDVEATKTEVTFDIEKVGNVGTIDSISLFDATTDELVQKGDADTRKFEDLLSDHKYNLYIDFSYPQGEETIKDWVKYEDINTIAKVTPTIEISEDSISDVSIDAELELMDEDSIGFIESVQLFKGDTLVATNSEKEISFNELDSFTDYKLVVTYKYDLNDGEGEQTETFEKEYKTAPHLEFVSCKVINSSAVSEGDTIYIQATLVNPSGATPVSAVVNGETYSCSGSTSATKIYLEIVNNGQFKGGLTELTIEQVNMTIDGKEYSVLAHENNTGSIFINGILDVVSIAFTNEDDEVIDYCFRNDNLKIAITLDNETDYIIDEIKLNYVDYTMGELEKIDKNHYQFSAICDNDFYSGTAVAIDSIKYHNEYINKTIEFQQTAKVYSQGMSVLDEVVEISNVDELLALRGHLPESDVGKYYKLTDDIDLSGIEWTEDLGILQAGSIFDGCGHKISNLTNVSTFTDKIPHLSLFNSTMYATIKNVTLDEITIIVTVNSTTNRDMYVYYGGICEYSYGTIENCSVSGDIVFNNNSDYGNVYAGGIAAYANDVINCSTDVSISASIIKNSYPYLGGIVGSVSPNSVVKNCKANVSLSCRNGDQKTGYACGIVGFPEGFSGSGSLEISDCEATGTMNAEYAHPIMYGLETMVETPFYDIIAENNIYDVVINGERQTKTSDDNE